MFRTKKETVAQALARKEGLPYGLSAIDGNFYVGAAPFLRDAGVADIWAPAPPEAGVFDPTDPSALTAPEIAAVLARLADLWRGSDEAPAIRSVAYALCKAFQAKDPAGFNPVRFWQACRIDPEPNQAPCPAPGHLDPADPRPGIVTTADCGWCGEPVRVR